MRQYRHLTRRQRYIIEELLGLEKSYSFIARELAVHRATISREVRRNSSRRHGYHAKGAQAFAMGRKPHPVEYRRKISGAVEEAVTEKLSLGWSPEQISGRLKLENKASVSHETIYRFVYMDRRCGGRLFKCLRLHNRRRIRGGKQNRLWKKIENRKFIEQRPETADLRAEFGHWERDLVQGMRNSGSLLTIVDRKSRYTLLERVKTRFSDEVSLATERAFQNRPEVPKLTLTNDNGCEFGEFHKLEEKLRIPIYFTHPYCSWERGTNENTNGLLRQFFPKRSDFREIKPEDVEYVQDLLNSRPRKTFDYRTPSEVLFSKQTKLIRSKRSYEEQIQKRSDEINARNFGALG